MTPLAESLVMREATEADARALRRLAGRDSAPVPAAPVLLAEVAGDVVAAASLRDGTFVADPFRPTAAVARLLVARARQLSSAPRTAPAKLRECPRATRSTAQLAA